MGVPHILRLKKQEDYSMKQVKDFTIIQFTYDTKEERDAHVLELENQGWTCTGQLSRLKNDVSIHDEHLTNSSEYFSELFKDSISQF